MFLTSIRRKKKSSGQDSLTGFKKRRLNSENYLKTRKLIDEFNLEEVFGENVKVCGYSRNEDVNQNVLNKEYIDVITIDIEVERVKNDVSKKKKDSSETKQDWLSIRTRGSPKVLYNLMKNLSPAQMKDIIDIGFSSMIGMASEEIPGKIAHFVVDNFDDDSMKLKLLNYVISITPKLVYKVLGVPLGGEDINRMNRIGIGDVTTLEWHGQLSNKNPTPKKVYDKIQESQMGRILFKLNFIVLFSNAIGLSGKGGQCKITKFFNKEELQRTENLSPAQMKDIVDIGFVSMIGMASEEIPGKIAHFVNFDDDSMKLKLSNGVISITPELVYKVLGVPLGGEDINRMNRLGIGDVTTLEWHDQFSNKNPTPKKVYDKIQES
nr:hypothetical protein [Tanacetum cinerariifolium]